MNFESILNLLLLVVVLYIAFRVGAVILRILLGLAAIALLVWFVSSALGGASP